jgi:hypothetical protein
MSDVYEVGLEGINDLIVRAEQLETPGRAELMRAVRDHGISVLFVDRYAVVPMKPLRQTQWPTVIVIGDDDCHRRR